MEEGQRHFLQGQQNHAEEVLILVVMEEGQRRAHTSLVSSRMMRVLILVVMEEGQRPEEGLRRAVEGRVLILVVMEEGQRLRAYLKGEEKSAWVLILVVMEEGQRQLDESFI